MTFDLRAQQFAWRLIHDTDLTDADIATGLGITKDECAFLRADHAALGATATGDFFRDQKPMNVT